MEIYARKISLADPICVRARAELHVHRNELDEAEQLFKELLKDNQNAADALNGLGVVAYHRRNPAKAEKLFRAALEADPNCNDARANLEDLRGVKESFHASESDVV